MNIRKIEMETRVQEFTYDESSTAPRLASEMTPSEGGHDPISPFLKMDRQWEWLTIWHGQPRDLFLLFAILCTMLLLKIMKDSYSEYLLHTYSSIK
jgi:hypothetical protein